MTERTHDIAQLNVGRLRAPVDDPLVAEFMNALDPINDIADESPGFCRLVDQGGGTRVPTWC